jgi:hypothetical protein
MIQLDEARIEHVLPRVAVGLQKYRWLQAALHKRDVSRDPEFQLRFNGFYRVRRNAEWRYAFYDILEREKAKPPAFADVLLALYVATKRIEASFASKLAATIDPRNPVIDSIVLGNLGLRLPISGTISRRLEKCGEVHDFLTRLFSEYLSTEMGQYLVARFESSYPRSELTGVKMLDLVLWQAR